MGTGRKLPRPAGGPMASQDVYEDQVWKKEVGVARVIEWCVAGIEVRDLALPFSHSCSLPSLSTFASICA